MHLAAEWADGWTAAVRVCPRKVAAVTACRALRGRQRAERETPPRVRGRSVQPGVRPRYAATGSGAGVVSGAVPAAAGVSMVTDAGRSTGTTLTLSCVLLLFSNFTTPSTSA